MLFEIYQCRDGQWRWRLWQNWSSDYKAIATTSEGYNSKAECQAAIKVVKSAGNAEVREFYRGSEEGADSLPPPMP